MTIAALNTLINATAQNASQFKGLSAAYGILLGGTPSIDGYTALINQNNSTNFGAGGTTVFNDENIYINTINALYQGNPTAKATFDAIVASAATIQDALTLVYNFVIPTSARTEAGLNFFKSQAAFYAGRAAELGVAGTNGTALVAFAALTKIAVDNDIGGLGDTINDLRAAVANGTAAIPQGGTVFTPLETADGTQFDVDDVAGGANQGTSFTLTTAADNYGGTGGNDSVTGYVNVGTPALSTFTGADTINGGAGTDSLSFTVENGAGALPGASITSIENFFIRDIGGGGTYNFATVTGEQQVWSDRSTAAVTVNGLGTGATVGLKGDGATVLGNVTFKYATATDAISIAIDGGVGATGTVPTITRNDTGAAAVTITSTGAANKVGVIDLDNAATTVKAVTIDATTNLTATLAADYAADATLTIKGGAATVDLSGAALSANFKSVDASAMTAGGASVVLGANTTAYTGGAGNDTVNIAALVFNGAVKVDGGAGTGDILAMTDQAALAAGTKANLVNFEVLRIGDDDDNAADTFDASLLAGLTAVQLGATSANDAVTINGLSAALAGAVTMRGTQTAGPTFGVTGATTVGQIDTLKLTIDDGAAAKNTITTANLTASGVEIVNINAVDNFTATTLTGLTQLTNLNVTGAGDVNLTTDALALNANTVIDASAATGVVTIDASGATGFGLKIMTGTGADVITGTGAADLILAGGGNDKITGGNGIDTITTGAGRDTIITATAAANRDNVTDFTVGAAGDALSFAGLKANNVAATAGDAGAATVINYAASGNLTAAAGQFVFQISVENVAGALSTDGASVLNALVTGAGSGTITVANAADNLIFLVSNGTDVGVYLGGAALGNADTALVAGEIALIGVIQGVSSTTSLIGGTNGNFIFA